LDGREGEPCHPSIQSCGVRWEKSAERFRPAQKAQQCPHSQRSSAVHFAKFAEYARRFIVYIRINVNLCSVIKSSYTMKSTLVLAILKVYPKNREVRPGVQTSPGRRASPGPQGCIAYLPIAPTARSGAPERWVIPRRCSLLWPPDPAFGARVRAQNGGGARNCSPGAAQRDGRMALLRSGGFLAPSLNPRQH
jgi:hypothetical protein